MGKGSLRNEPCFCDSGKKFKWCCLNKGRKVFAHWRKKRGLVEDA